MKQTKKVSMKAALKQAEELLDGIGQSENRVYYYSNDAYDGGYWECVTGPDGDGGDGVHDNSLLGYGDYYTLAACRKAAAEQFGPKAAEAPLVSRLIDWDGPYFMSYDQAAELLAEKLVGGEEPALPDAIECHEDDGSTSWLFCFGNTII